MRQFPPGSKVQLTFYARDKYSRVVAEVAAYKKPNPAKKGPPIDEKWQGFRGLKWGTNIADAPGMVLVEDSGDNKFYQREGEKLAIGDAQLTEINYGFYKGRFDGVTVEVKDYLNWTVLRDVVFASYG
ncbi:MAG: hypothetical protein JRG73_20905, partial [Deltaproteobacteria bacterium]|nr:hypothetical protein [Deltaproteobacteria bacterium]